MPTPEDTSRPHVTYPAVGAFVVLCGLFYLHLSLFVDPRLLYHQHFPVFLTGFDFLGDFLVRPGGPVEYVSRFLAQFTCWRWGGAAVITGVAVVMCLTARAFLNAGTTGDSHHFAPGTGSFEKGVRTLLPVGPEGASHKRVLTPFSKVPVPFLRAKWSQSPSNRYSANASHDGTCLTCRRRDL